MARIDSYAPSEAAHIVGIEHSTLTEWLRDGKVQHTSTGRISILELPTLRALRDDRPLCERCRNTRRDPGGGDCTWCNRRVYGTCQTCGSPYELLTTDAYAECLSCRGTYGPGRAKTLHWKVCHCAICKHSEPDECEDCDCCGGSR